MAVDRPAAVVILAAGEGTRMRSALPKVLHPIAGRSMLGHVLEAASALEPHHVIVVVGHGRDLVVEHVAEIAPWARTVVQDEQLGTGHAVRLALQSLPGVEGTVVVLSGDTPLLTGTTLTVLVDHHASQRPSCTVLTAVVSDPTGYGRIVRDATGNVTAIVEERDASAGQRAIDEINSGIYAFDAARLTDSLTSVSRENAQGEEYLTDTIAILRSAGDTVAAVPTVDAAEVAGVNDRVQLAAAAAAMRDRINEGWMRQGVSILDPASTWIDVDVDLAADCTIWPDTYLLGPTSIATGARIGPGTTLTSCEVREGAQVIHTWAELAVIGEGAQVGPFTYLRPGAILGARAKAGAYVEIKNSQVGDDSKVPHLSYVGDAQIGVGTNIGAATVFVNYDGQQKFRTTVGDHVRIGSDTMLVAPVTVGDGAYTAAGSVITDDVPAGAMAVGRARQRTIEGWVERKRPDSESARAAQRHTAHTHDEESE